MTEAATLTAGQRRAVREILRAVDGARDDIGEPMDGVPLIRLKHLLGVPVESYTGCDDCGKTTRHATVMRRGDPLDYCTECDDVPGFDYDVEAAFDDRRDDVPEDVARAIEDVRETLDAVDGDYGATVPHAQNQLTALEYFLGGEPEAYCASCTTVAPVEPEVAPASQTVTCGNCGAESEVL